MDILKEIPEVTKVKDNFGGDYYFIPAKTLSKRKAWNMLLKRGFEKMPNPQYIKKGSLYAYDNKLHNYLVIEIAKEA